MDLKSIFLQNKQKYFIIVILSIILVFAGFMIEIFYSSKKINSKTHKIQVEKVILIKNNISILEKEINYEKYLKSFTFINKFYNNTKDKFEYNRIFLNWDKLKLEDKLKWFQNHFFVNKFGCGLIQYTFILQSKEAKDYEYISIKAEELLNDYIDFMNKDIKEIYENVSFMDIGICKINTSYNVKNNYLKKYLFYNFLLGLLFGLTVCVLDILRKKFF